MASSNRTAVRSDTKTTNGAARRSFSSCPPPTRPQMPTPMTERLYYTDPYAQSFDATVAAVGQRDGRTIVFLDRTAFYPTSGGQPFDTGTLAGARVIDVLDE